MRISAVAGVDQVASEDWAPLAAGRGLYLAHGFLRGVETSRGAAGRLVLAHDDDGRLVGALPLHRLDEPGEVNPAYDPAVALGSAASVPTAVEEWFPCLLAGTRSGYHNELPIDRRLADEERARVARALVCAAQAVADDEARSLAFMHLMPEALGEVRRASGLEAVALGQVVTAIDVTWSSLEDYLVTRRLKVRRDARRELRRFAAAPLDVAEHSLRDVVELCATMVANVNAAHGYPTKAAQLVPRLEALAAAFDEDAVVLLAREAAGRAPVALALSFACDGELYQWAWGCDPARLRREHEAYFNLVYYRPISMAIERGLRRLHLGTDAYSAKLRRGAQLEPRWSLFRPPATADGWRAALVPNNHHQIEATAQAIGVPDELPADAWLRAAGITAG